MAVRRVVNRRPSAADRGAGSTQGRRKSGDLAVPGCAPHNTPRKCSARVYEVGRIVTIRRGELRVRPRGRIVPMRVEGTYVCEEALAHMLPVRRHTSGW